MKKNLGIKSPLNLAATFKKIVGSQAFFWGLIGFFVVEAAWIAFSGAYPLFYDELYHLSFIDTYSRQLSPFLTSQDFSTAFLGDITRTPSYIYHYLMSFPYRWAEPFVPEFYHHVLIMRFINIGFVAAGLVLFKKLFDEIKIPVFIRNTALFFTILIPAFPFVAAHINYDNLLFLITPLALLFGVKFVKQPSAAKLIWITVVLMLGCLVKHTFVIIAVPLAIFLFFWIYGQQKNGKEVFQALGRSLKSSPRAFKFMLAVALIVTSLLFVERIGQNIVEYRSIAPSCQKVQTAEFCSQSSTVRRSERLKEEASSKPDKSASEYTGLWAGSMMDSLFSEFNSSRGTRFEHKQPLPVLNFFAWTALILGVMLFIRHYPYVKNRFGPYVFVLFIPLIYLALTFAFNYNTFRELRVPAAVQGRYLLIIVPVLILMGLLAFQRTKAIAGRYKAILLGATMIVFLQGGLVNYIIQSDSSWYEDKSKVIKINEEARQILSPFIYR